MIHLVVLVIEKSPEPAFNPVDVPAHGGHRGVRITAAQGLKDGAMFAQALPVVDLSAAMVETSELDMGTERSIRFEQDAIIGRGHEELVEDAIVLVIGAKVVKAGLRLQRGYGIELTFHPP